MREETARSGLWTTCRSCRHHNGEWESRCQKCGRGLSASRTVSGSAPATPPQSPAGASAGAAESRRHRKSQKIVPAPPAFPDHLRRQLQDRVHRYRARQHDPDAALPFEEEPGPPPNVISFPAPAGLLEERVRLPQVRSPRPNRANSRVNMPDPQSALDFHRGALPDQVWRSRPVAPLRLRLAAHLRDMEMVAAAAALFLAALPLAPYLGVPIQPQLILLGGIVCGSLLLGLLYALLFVWGAGVTPGMKRTGLRLVTFDGLPAPRRQRLWRIFGSIVSAGSFLLGFLWAVVDEEKLYWHDHISKTYLTLADS